MTGPRRQALRMAVDAAVRAAVTTDGSRVAPDACGGCGGPRAGWVLDCTLCRDRHTKMIREGRHPDPDWYRARRAVVAAEAEMRRRGMQTGSVRPRNGHKPSDDQRRKLGRFFTPKEVAA